MDWDWGENESRDAFLKGSETTLGEAVAALLAMDPFPREAWLQISPARARALLTYSSDEEEEGIRKTHFAGRGKTPDGIVLDANLYRGLSEIAKALSG